MGVIADDGFVSVALGGPGSRREGVLDIESFDRAVARLQEGWARYARDPSDLQIRDGLIQRFAFTCELAHKTMKRYLSSISATPALYDAMPFADLIPAGSAAGLLLNDWPAWRRYRDMRSRTSHTYQEAAALAVVTEIPGFLADAAFLRDVLRARLAA